MRQKVYIVMGVSGSGKTTVGKLFAEKRSLPYYDADDFHPPENVAKMSAGIPLTDEDRIPWLRAMAAAIQTWQEGAVLACSALKETYRNMLSENNTLEWVYLKGDFETILQRMKARKHFMKPEMLQSQFEALEPPAYGIHLDITESPETLVSQLLIKTTAMKHSQWGIIGMGVMGQSLAKNALRKNHSLSVYNRNTPSEKDVIPNLLSEVNTPELQGFTELEAFAASLETPRKVLLMIPAGEAIDTLLKQLLPFLEAGDILMDGGNSHYQDTQRREKMMQDKGFHYLGIGISGGEKGALEGPSLMVGGTAEAYGRVKNILESLAARDSDLQPCVALLGPNGAGHYVKTLHNGIEYAEMQLLAEVYALLRPSLSYPEMVNFLQEWNENAEASFLLETVLHILQKKEKDDYLLDKVLDLANSKGTGSWSSISALEQAYPATLLVEAVMARAVSQYKTQREYLEKALDVEPFIATLGSELLRQAYQFSRILNHYQGLELIRITSEAEGWNIDLAEVVRVWTNGCILRSQLLKTLYPLLKEHHNLLEHKAILELLSEYEISTKSILSWGLEQRTALPCMSSALHYWLGMTTGSSSANLIQALRDAFGAHTFQRSDSPGESFTTNWEAHE